MDLHWTNKEVNHVTKTILFDSIFRQHNQHDVSQVRPSAPYLHPDVKCATATAKETQGSCIQFAFRCVSAV